MKTIHKKDAFPELPRLLRVAAYAWVSNGKDAMRHSLFAQVSYYNEYIQQHIDWQFAGIYADDAVTGTRDSRAEFQRLLADCRAGKIDLVVTKSVTRFARNSVTTLETVRELKSLGIDVYFEKENIHAISGDGELMLSILASFAQEESRSVSENCKWRIRRMFAEGRPNIGKMLGYRLLDGKFYIVPSEAEIVRQIFTDYLGGMGLEAIAKKLDAGDVRPARSAHWRRLTIHKILRNEKYSGNMLLQKTYRNDHISKKKCINHGELPIYRVENSHEAIIDPATFSAAQAEIARRAAGYKPPAVSTEKSVFTGIIRCGQCGAAYCRKHTAYGKNYDKIAWICLTFNELGKTVCDSQRIPETILMAKTTEVLGLADFDEAVFREQIAAIRVPDHNRLCFVFRDGHSAEVEWQHQSRRESWTPEMKQAARERQLKINEERKKRDATTD